MNQKSPPDEHPITLFVNGQELATYQLTKQDLEDWVIGQLFNEGLIESYTNISKLEIDEGQGKIWTELDVFIGGDLFAQRRKYFTAGCGRGATFLSLTDLSQFAKVNSSRMVTLSFLSESMRAFMKSSPLYIETGGMHGACLVDAEGNLYVREDIGRHNAVDKVIGFALRKGLRADELVLLTTGRISYEMLAKAARFGIGVIASRTAATQQAIQLANLLQIDVVGYVRGQMAQVYTSIGRVHSDPLDLAAVES